MKCTKILEIALVLVFATSLVFPVAAVSVEIVASGQCGKNACWKLDEDGILFITGNGPMSDFSAGAPAPWANLYGSVSAVIVSEGITTIGSYAFWCPNPFGYFNITNITIPRSVTYIAPTAFESCPLLQDVYYWDTYDRWVKLTENTQSGILQSVTLHGSDRTVSMCGAYTYWEFADDGTLTISGSGPMTDWDGYTVAPWHNIRDSITKIVVKPGVTHVGSFAFKWSSAKELILADSVLSIGNYAFERCDFVRVHLGGNLAWIGEGAFEECRELTAVTLPNTLTETGRFIFRGCTSLITANLGGLSSVSRELFSGCSSLIAVYIPRSVSSMSWGVFYNTGLRNVFYGGTAAQLQQIYDEGGNTAVTDAVIHYNTDSSSAVYYLENINLFCDHEYGDWTNEGQTHNRTCKICKNLESVAHSWDGGRVTTQAKCNYSGTRTFNCTICNATKKEDIEKTAHAFGDYCVDSSGKHKRTCAVCFYDEIGGEHIWDEGRLVREPSCKVYGIYQYNCTICPSSKSIAVAKLTTHIYSSANDTQCDICGYVTELPSCGEETANHTWNSGATTKKATCKEKGVKTFTCTTCNAPKTESIAKLTTHTYDHDCDIDCNVCGVTRTTTHNYKTSWSKGKTNHWYECSICKDKQDVAAHTPGAEATATTAQTCTICGYEIAPALGEEETTAPSEVTDGTAPTIPVDQGDSNNEFPVWVVIVIAVVAIGGVAAFVVIKKKKS